MTLPAPHVRENVVQLASQRSARSTLKNGNNGGTFDGMEARVKHLEDDMKEVKSDLKTLIKDVSEIKGKIGMLPGWGGLMLVTGFIVTAVGLMLRFMPPVG